MIDPTRLTPAQLGAWDRETAHLELMALIRAEATYCPVPCCNDGWTDTKFMPLETWATS